MKPLQILLEPVQISADCLRYNNYVANINLDIIMLSFAAWEPCAVECVMYPPSTVSNVRSTYVMQCPPYKTPIAE